MVNPTATMEVMKIIAVSLSDVAVRYCPPFRTLLGSTITLFKRTLKVYLC